jgi:iron complex outermembrane receptor protein
MHIRFARRASAVACGLAAAFSPAQAQDPIRSLPEVTVTASPFGTDESVQVLAPARVIAGDELRNRLETSIGDLLSHELGVSSSHFGAAASRPVIRGLGGPRVKVLQNGMGIADVSTISEDHAVGGDVASARQVEVLRGPAALLYGSGAVGGLVNIVNDRIPVALEEQATGEAELRYSSAERAPEVSLAADGAAGNIGLHIDASWRDAENYAIPGLANRSDPASARGRLPNSFARRASLGLGASHITAWGHVGASLASLEQRYGVPSEEGAQIDLRQMRYDTDALVRDPFAGIESLRIKLGYTDYQHTELDAAGTPEVDFTNKALESRWELRHRPLDGWRGVFGLQSEHARFAALGADPADTPTVPRTRSAALAAFLVEEKDFGALRGSAGLRLESVERRPASGTDRSFNLASWSLGGLWTFAPGYGFGTTFSYAQRAPSTEELYSNGAHHATETFDIGNPALRKETSRNLELSLQKTSGLVRWKTNLFYNRVNDFMFGQLTGNEVDEDGAPGGDLAERMFTQADATVHGAEAEISYNLRGQGFSVRGFADTSRGRLNNAGNLPLQPATRVGVDLGYRQGAWQTGANLVHALRQERLAAFEANPAAAYTRLDAHLSYTQRLGAAQLTWFALVRNLLDEDIRLSTSLLKDSAPLPGRSIVLGLRTRF